MNGWQRWFQPSQNRRIAAYDGGGLGKGGAVTLYTDGNKTGEGRLEHIEPRSASAASSPTSAATT